jgi:hypothetical protein
MRIVRANVEASWDVIDAILALRRAVVLAPAAPNV